MLARKFLKTFGKYKFPRLRPPSPALDDKYFKNDGLSNRTSV